MADINTQLLDALLASELSQYGDARVYRAAMQLKPEDRPKVPVTVTEPDPAKYPIFRLSKPGAFAGVSETQDGIRAIGPIVVNKRSTEYNDPDSLLLASVLAHEAQHYRTGNAEAPAYAKAIAFLQGTRYRDSPYVKQLMRVAAKHREDK